MKTGGYVYIMNNRKGGQVYIGVTADLVRRVSQHKHGEGSKWARKYNCTRLVYYEYLDRIGDAIAREKPMKEWNRSWKNELIETMNLEWRDLSDEVVG